MGQVSIFHKQTSGFPTTMYGIDYFNSIQCFCPCVKINFLYVFAVAVSFVQSLILPVSVLVPSNHITLSLHHSLKSAVMPCLALLLFSRLFFSILGLFQFQVSFRVDLSCSVRCAMGILIGLALNLYKICGSMIILTLLFCLPSSRGIIPFSNVLFNLIFQIITISFLEKFHSLSQVNVSVFHLFFGDCEWHYFYNSFLTEFLIDVHKCYSFLC